jgi:hypothetical protein
MSDSGRGKFSKTGLKWSIAAASLFVAALTAGGACVQSGYYQQAANQTAKHQRWAKNEIRAGCPSFANLTKTECTYQATQAAQENERAEYDLYAQRTSALWAAIMAFAALLGIGLSGVGIWLIKVTYDATKATNEAYIAAERGWLKVQPMGAQKPDGSDVVEVQIVATKTGRTFTEVTGLHWNVFDSPKFRKDLREYRFESLSFIFDETQNHNHNIRVIDVSPAAAFVGGWVTYRINFPGERRSYFFFSIKEGETDVMACTHYAGIPQKGDGWPENT